MIGHANNPMVRPAEPGEAESLTALAFRSKASNGYDAVFMEACRAELTYSVDPGDPLTDTWVAEAPDGGLLGFFQIGVCDGMAEVLAVFVDPTVKRQALGRQLWARLEARARHLGAMAICADADPHALPFYQDMGMTVVGWSPSGSIPGRFLPRLIKRFVPGPNG